MAIAYKGGEDLRRNVGPRDQHLPTFIRTVPIEDVLGSVTDDSGDDITLAHTTINRLDHSSILELWTTAKTQNYAGGDSIEVKLYREDFPGVYSQVGSAISITTAAATDGVSAKNLVTDSNDYIRSCTHYSVSGTFTVAAGGSLIVTMGKLGAVAG